MTSHTDPKIYHWHDTTITTMHWLVTESKTVEISVINLIQRGVSRATKTMVTNSRRPGNLSFNWLSSFRTGTGFCRTGPRFCRTGTRPYGAIPRTAFTQFTGSFANSTQAGGGIGIGTTPTPDLIAGRNFGTGSGFRMRVPPLRRSATPRTGSTGARNFAGDFTMWVRRSRATPIRLLVGGFTSLVALGLDDFPKRLRRSPAAGLDLRHR